MTIRKFIVASTIAGISSLGLANIAAAASVWVPKNSGENYVFDAAHMPQSTVTRKQVQTELDLARAENAAANAAGGNVGGERGWVPEAHSVAYVDGKWIHTDKIDHTTKKPSLRMTATEKAEANKLYGNGGN